MQEKNKMILFCIWLIGISSVATSEKARQLCDVRMWYLNLINDGVFDIELTEDQQQLKNNIEALVKKSTNNKERKIDCQVIYMYNDLLQEEFNNEPLNSSPQPINDDTHVSDAIKDSHGDSGNKQAMTEMEDSNTDELSADKTNLEHTKEFAEDEQAIIDIDNESTLPVYESESNANEIDGTESIQEIIESKHDAEAKTESLIETMAYSHTSQMATDKLDDDTEHIANANKYELQSDGALDTIEELDESEIDETDIIDDDDNVAVNTDRENDINDEQSNSRNSTMTKTIPFGICRSFGCFQINRYSVEEQVTIHQNKTTLSPQHRLNHMCELGVYCHNKCYYILSTTYCLLGYRLSNYLIEASEEVAEVFSLSTHAFDIQDQQDNEDRNISDVDVEKDVYNENLTEEHVDHDFPDIQEGSKDNINLPQKAPETFKNLVYPENPHAKIHETIEQSEESYKDLKHAWEKEYNEKIVQDHLDFPFKQLEQMINQKTIEYSHKIQTLELMLMKLENQLLTERLNKQDHSSTITRLENLMLRLENDLLKMSKNYEKLKEETEHIGKKQNKYLEIAQRPASQYPQIPDSNVKNMEELSKQQIQINAITYLVSNLTGNIHHLKQRSDYLEEQNQKLHQMIMNQTILMSSMIQNVHSLTEENAKQRQESSELKKKLDNILSPQTDSKTSKTLVSNQVLGELVNSLKQFVSDDKITVSTNESPGNEYKDNNEGNEDTEKAFVQWCSNAISAFPICHYQSIRQLHCIPFNSIQWCNCTTKQRKHLAKEHISISKNNKPSVPKVIDNNLDEDNTNNQNTSKHEQASNIGPQHTENKHAEEDKGIHKTYSNNLPIISDIQDEKSTILNSSNDNKFEIDQMNQPEKQDMGCEECGKASELETQSNIKTEPDETMTVKENLIEGTKPDISNTIPATLHTHEDKNQQTYPAELLAHTEQADPELSEHRVTKSETLPETEKVKQMSTSVQQLSPKIDSESKTTHNEMKIKYQTSEVLPDSNAEINKQTMHKRDTQFEESNSTYKPDTEKIKNKTNNTPEVFEESSTEQHTLLGKHDESSEATVQSKTISGSKPHAENTETESKTKQMETKTKAETDNLTLKEIITEEKDIHAKSDEPSENIVSQQESKPKTIEMEKTAETSTLHQAEVNAEKKENIVKNNTQTENVSNPDGLNTRQKEKTHITRDEQSKKVDKNEISKENIQQELNHKQTGEMGKGKVDKLSNDVKTQETKHIEQKDKELIDKPATPQKEIKTHELPNPEKEATKGGSSPESIKEKEGKPMQQNQKEKTAKPERLAPINLVKEKQKEAKDCYDYYSRGNRKDGTYKVRPAGSPRTIQVYCDMKQGGWTLILKRQDGTTNFFEEWDDYKKGFGGLYGEHWLGNNNIHLLTNQDYYTLRVDLMDWEKNKRHAHYDYFLVENEDNAYRLHIDGYSGDAGDGLSKHNGSKFSTKDVDNDKVVKEFGGSCANRFQGAGWYYKCYASNLNGKYYRLGKIPEKRFDGITWKPWMGPNYSMKMATMKIRPASAEKSVRLVN